MLETNHEQQVWFIKAALDMQTIQQQYLGAQNIKDPNFQC